MPAIAFLVKESLSSLIKVVTTPRNMEYLIGQKFVGRKWRNFGQVTEVSTDEIKYRRKFRPTNNFDLTKILTIFKNFYVILVFTQDPYTRLEM